LLSRVEEIEYGSVAFANDNQIRIITKSKIYSNKEHKWRLTSKKYQKRRRYVCIGCESNFLLINFLRVIFDRLVFWAIYRRT